MRNMKQRVLSKLLILLTFSCIVTLDDTYSFLIKCRSSEVSNEITLWVDGSTVKIRPFDDLGSDRSVHIKAAKNEYEAFQVAVTSLGGLMDVDVTVSDLVGNEGTIDSEYIRLYREEYVNVYTPSNVEGKVGLWPDPLIPAIDPFFNETRNAFPFDVPDGQSRAIWVDIFVPSTTSAGTYSGSLIVTASGMNPAHIPIALTVWDFELPSTSSLVSAFGFDDWELLAGHYGSHEPYDQIVPLSKLYAESGLMHRISLESVTGEDWSIYPSSSAESINWTSFDANWGPFLDGIDLPYGLKGAKLTSIRLNEWGDTDEERRNYWQQYAIHFKEKGWFDRLFDYTWDEPSEDREFEELKKKSSLVKDADEDLRVLVTANIQQGVEFNLEDVIDIWVPIINEMHGKPGSEHEGNQRNDYNEALNEGYELWWYQSCESHGCYWCGNDEHTTGWPSYMIDIPAMYNRIMEWQSFKYNISGELYYSTNYAYEFYDDGSNDPWNNLYYFGGNGDGTLFYPGRTDKIGGTHHIPIESIRLKMIREGMEDYEYMKMLRDLGEEFFARSQVDSVLTNAYTFSHDPQTLYSARERMAQQILSITSTSTSIPTPSPTPTSKQQPEYTPTPTSKPPSHPSPTAMPKPVPTQTPISTHFLTPTPASTPKSESNLIEEYGPLILVSMIIIMFVAFLIVRMKG